MLYSQPADGSGSAEYVLKADFVNRFQPESWSPDGKSLIFYSDRGIWIACPNADRKPAILFPGANPMLSPDGKWLAYSNEADTARSEIYVQPFPPTGVKYQVTTSWGRRPALVSGWYASLLFESERTANCIGKRSNRIRLQIRQRKRLAHSGSRGRRAATVRYHPGWHVLRYHVACISGWPRKRQTGPDQRGSELDGRAQTTRSCEVAVRGTEAPDAGPLAPLH